MTTQASKPLKLNVFYGYPAQLIADWCAVDVKTAARWKRGTQRPKAGHLRLFNLHAESRILPPGWRYDTRRKELVAPNDECVPLHCFEYVHLWVELAREYQATRSVLPEPKPYASEA